MNKKILLSVAAAATLAMTFTGCGSSDSTATTNSGTTGTSGFATLTDGTEAGASAGAAVGATTVKVGTTVTTTGGYDTVKKDIYGLTHDEALLSTDAANTNTIVSDTSFVDDEGRVIANGFTTAASHINDDDFASAMQLVATAAGVDLNATKAVYYGTAEDSELENRARIVENFVAKVIANGTSSTTLLTKIASSSSLAELATSLNKLLPASEQFTTEAIASLTAAANLQRPATNFAKAFAVVDANKSITDMNTTFDENTVTLSGLILDANTTTTTITSDLAGISSVNDSNVSDDYMNDSDGLNQTGELVVSITNQAEDSINSNASFAFYISNLTVASVSDKATFAMNANTTFKFTANSNMSVATTMDEKYGDLNSTYIKAVYSSVISDGNDINMTALINLGSSLVGTDYDSDVDGNFTSGMMNGNFSAKALMNINDQKFITSDKAYTIALDSILVGKDATDGSVGSSISGYKVLDANLTK